MNAVQDTVTITKVQDQTTNASGQPLNPNKFTRKPQMRQFVNFVDSQGHQRSGSCFCDIDNPQFTAQDYNQQVTIEITNVQRGDKVYTNIKRAAAAPVQPTAPNTMPPTAPTNPAPATMPPISTTDAKPTRLTPIDRMLGEQLADIRDSILSMSNAQNALLEAFNNFVARWDAGQVANNSMEPKQELPTIPFDEKTAVEFAKNPQDNPFGTGAAPAAATPPAEADQDPPDLTNKAEHDAMMESGDVRPPAEW